MTTLEVFISHTSSSSNSLLSHINLNQFMKQIFLTLTLLLISILPASAAKKIEANPINIAVNLVEKTDSLRIASTLDYYGYTYQNTEDGYTVMQDTNGNEIRYSFKEIDSSNKYPIVIVKIQGTHKAIDSKLKELDFEKIGNCYEHMRNEYSKYRTQCKFSPKSTMIIRRILNL